MALLLAWGLAGAAGCEPEKPPAPEGGAVAGPAKAGSDAEAEPVFFKADETPAVLTYAADRGAFSDGSKVDDIPERSRGMVRVTLVGGTAPPAGKVWVANLKESPTDAGFKLETVARDLFEELALGQGLSSDVALPEGLEPPKTLAAPSGGVIVYKTAWCGVCKKVEAYLKRKNIEYVAKDIEKDRTAAAELKAKAAKAGTKTGSVPVIDVGGQLIVGFDRARLERLLAKDANAGADI